MKFAVALVAFAFALPMEEKSTLPVAGKVTNTIPENARGGRGGGGGGNSGPDA
jgi:hypothetical protein